jgi:iron complex transport system substrate-binding protein
VLGGAAGLAAAALARVTLAQEGTPAASPAADGPWSFTDDNGVTVTLPKRPTRIAADVNAAAPLWDFGIKPIAVSGWTVLSDASWGNVDRSTPTIVAAEGLPEPDIEALLEMQAELFVTILWGPGDIWSFTTPENYAATQQVVPVICISVAETADVNLQRFIDLAVALGVDLETPELVQAKADFEAAVTAFSTLATEKADITSFFGAVSAGGETWSAAYPPDWADLAWYQSLGMTIIEPDAEPGMYWEDLSGEEAVKYPADIFFNSTRAGSSTKEELMADPLFGMHPAIAAGQIGAWNQDFILSYQGLKAAIDTMSATLATAEKVTG